MHIYGNIVKIESYATQKSPAVIKIINAENNKNYKVKYLGYLPVQEYDSINGQVDEELNFISKPLVVPVESYDYLKKSLYACLRKTNFGHKKCEDFLNELNIYCGKINDIFEDLNSWAADEATRKFTTDVITTLQMTKFLRWWRKNYLLRRLYLLGLNNREINFSYLPLDKLYNQLVDNPFCLHSINLEKAQEISELLGKENKKNNQIGGKITRFIYQSNWTSTPLSYVVKGFPEIHLCLEYIKDNFPLVFEDKFVYSRFCYDMEITIANLISVLLIRTQDDQLRNLNLPKSINKIQVDKDIELTLEQQKALEGTLDNHISVVTGGAGCGKTTLIKQIVKNLIYRKEKFVLTSFTGKAVLRMKEILGKDYEKNCFTLSLLIQKKKYRTGPPSFDILVIDEASMISGALFYEFLQYYKHIFKIILVGDNNQLPPIGLCSFFQEIIRSQKVPVYYLRENKRILNNQKSSNILFNANRLIDPKRNLKEPFQFAKGKGFEIIEGDKKICYSIISALSKKGITMEKITVLTPYNKDIGEINKYAQSIFLNDIDVYQYGQRAFILGDRMMQTVNVYNQEHGEVMNGEEGIITNISGDNLTVVFNKQKTINYKWDDNKKIKLDFSESSNHDEENSEKDYLTCDLKHSFCKTVHKSQGSEYEYVIIYLPPTKGSFVNINLLYTAITRTKKTVWLVVDKDSLDKASRTKLAFRYDRLSERINEIV